jgi:hypothetical protein
LKILFPFITKRSRHENRYYFPSFHFVHLDAVWSVHHWCLWTGQGSFPDKPVKIVVAFAPGAGTDAMGRLMAQKLGEVMGGSFVVENRTGASGAMPGTPSAQTRFIEADYQAWRDVVRTQNLKIE